MVRIGIIGCGAIARKRHAPACAAHARTQLVGFADASVERAREMAEQYGCRAYESIEAMLSDAGIEAVCVCVPEQFHEDVVLKCFAAGKHVLLEKPMAMNVEESERIVEAWKKAGTRLMIAFSQRFYEEHILAARLLREGSLGKAISFRSYLSNPGVEYAVYGADREFYDKRLKNIGGVMSNVGCHRIDLIRYIFDTEYDSVFAFTPALNKRFSDGSLIDREDHAMLTLKLENGVCGTLFTSWCNYGAPDVGTEIFCERGVIRTYDGEGVRVYRKDGGVTEYAVPHTQEDVDGFGVVNSFLDSMADGVQTCVTGYDGLICMRVLDAVERSNREGRWVLVAHENE